MPSYQYEIQSTNGQTSRGLIDAASLDEAYARLEGGELWIVDFHISPYKFGHTANHEPKRRRKLLLHAREIRKLKPQVEQKGLTLVPMAVYFRRGRVKCELALARGKRYVVFFRHPKRTGYFVIIDDVITDDVPHRPTGKAPHRFEWVLHPDDKHKLVEEGDGQFAFTGRVDLKIRIIEPQHPVHEKATFEGYGVDYLRVRSKEDRSRGLFVTILYPKKKDMELPEITEIRGDDVVGARIGEDIVLFNKRYGSLLDAGGVQSDGELAAIRISEGSVKQAIVLDGSWLTMNGEKVPFEAPGRRKQP